MKRIRGLFCKEKRNHYLLVEEATRALSSTGRELDSSSCEASVQGSYYCWISVLG
jgi:hypothetical protein